MPETQIFFYTVSFIAVSFGLLLVALVAVYLKLTGKYLSLREKRQKENLKLSGEVNKRLETAQKTSEQILINARIKAQEIIKRSLTIGEEQKERLSRDLEKISQDGAERYRRTIEESLEQVKVQIETLSRQMSDFSKKSVNQITAQVEEQNALFRNAARGEIEKLQTVLSQTVEAERKKVEEELSQYKRSRLDEINRMVIEAVRIVSKDVLGKTIPLQDKKDLVKKALERAKKEGIIATYKKTPV